MFFFKASTSIAFLEKNLYIFYMSSKSSNDNYVVESKGLSFKDAASLVYRKGGHLDKGS